VRGLIAALEAISPKLPPDLKVIPGHGVISNLDDVRAYVKRLKETLAVVEQGVQQGKTLDQLKQEKVLEPWKDLVGRLHLRRCVDRDSLQRPDRQGRHIHQAQLRSYGVQEAWALTRLRPPTAATLYLRAARRVLGRKP